MSTELTPSDYNGFDPVEGESPRSKVSDEENQSQSAAIRRIQKYRDRIAEYQMFFAENEITREIGEGEQHTAYHQLAKGFLQLLKPYLTDPEIPRSAVYWGEKDLGGFSITPPSAISRPSAGEMEAALRSGNRLTMSRASTRACAEPREYQVRGLKTFANAPAEWSEEWTLMWGPEISAEDLRAQINDPRVSVQPREHRTQPITVVKSARVPKHVIDDVITCLEQFVRDVGLDIEFSKEEQQTKIDRDLLEEVDEWRQNNVQ
jgi:hypothetical protein